MSETYDNTKIEHIQNIANSQFPYDDFYIYKNGIVPPNNNTSYKEKGYVLKEPHERDYTQNFKEHDIVYIPGFAHIAYPYCDTSCFNINGFGIVTQVYQDGKIEILFGQNKQKNVIYLFHPYLIEKWLRPTNLDHTFLLSRILKPEDGMKPDKLAQIITNLNGETKQHLPSTSIFNNDDNVDDKPPTFNDYDDGIIDPDGMAKAFNTEILKERKNDTWRDVPSDVETGGKNNLRKSKKNRKYKNKTIKAGNKNKSYEKQKGGHIDEKKLKDDINSIAVSNEIGATFLEGKDEIQKHHQDIDILFGYKTKNGSECWLGRKIANDRVEFDEYFFIQGKNSEKIV
tara:strand:+ start:12268 stop:13293 length:1026 start_codon:yes stop_codon:yes gene_type:complete